jgi:serine/threonine protein kinase
MADLLSRLTQALGDRYEIERELGSGGMATVFLARDLKHDRKVALKVLKPELSAVLGTDRFPREVKIVAQLQHPNILPLHDSGETEGFLYYVMPFVDGESLRARLSREGQLPVGEALRILREVVDALASAHAHGVVHRDIKPDNVMLSGRHALVMDFGVAKAVSNAGGEKLTTVGVAVGTPQYMAPEQAMAEDKIDHRADIYSVGVLAYEMLAGEPPFVGKTALAVLSAHVLEQPVDLRERRPGVPPQVAEAVMRCLAKTPADRWQSAEELLRHLETVAVTPSGGLTPTDTRPVQATPKQPSVKRRWWITSVAAAVLVFGGIGGWLALGHRGSHRIQRIGVLPIDDISGKDAVFVSAMHDALTNALSRLGTVGVASRATMMSYKGSAKTTREIAQELNLDAMVEATVFRAGDVMRINVQFERPATTQILWSDTYERDVQNVLEAQSDIVQRIAAAVGKVLAGGTSAGVAGG